MKSLFAIAALSLALSLCNLTDRLTKGDRNTNNANNSNANTVANGNNTNNQNNSNANNTNENSNDNSNSNLSANRNGNFGGEDDTDVEEGEVQAALMGIKRRWTQSIIDGDKATCRDVLADGFVNTDPSGAVTNKAQFCDAVTPSGGSVDAYTITDTRLANQTGASATMTYVLTFTKRGKRVQRWRDTDTFTKSDGRWKIISSASSPAG